MKSLIIVLFFSLSLVSNPFAQKKKTVATIFKPVGTVELKTGEKDWAKAKPGSPLNTGDLVRTGENSFAIIKFLENSVLRVQEKSEVTISGEIAKGEFSKNVFLEKGEVGFNVKKRPNEKFEFSTPTSVASIRGTAGLLISGLDSNDVLILGSGSIDFRNIISNLIFKVNGGQTVYSFTDGTLKVVDSSPEELRLLNQGSPDSGQTQGSNLPPDTGSTSITGISMNMTVIAPLSKENQDLNIKIEINQSSITIDSISSMSSDVTLFYRRNSEQAFKFVKGTFGGRTSTITIPGLDVFAPSIQIYTVLKLRDGSEFSAPSQSPETYPYIFPVQAGQKNEVRIEFTDPTGKKKTMVIEYK